MVLTVSEALSLADELESWIRLASRSAVDAFGERPETKCVLAHLAAGGIQSLFGGRTISAPVRRSRSFLFC